MSPDRAPSRVVLVAVVLAGLVGLASCGDKASGQEIVVKSSAATVDAGTAKVHEVISIKGGATALPEATVSGAVDFAAKRGALTTKVAGQRVDLVIDGTTLYERIPILADQLGTPWLKINLDDIGELAGVQGLGNLAQSSSSDPSSTLAYLRGAGQVAEVGHEKVRGEDTTHYHAVVDLERAASASPADQAKTLRQLAKVMGARRQPVDVWIDGDGLVRRMTETVDYRKATFPNVPKEQLPTSMSMLVEYFDFGTEVSVDVPKASEVTDIKDLLGRAGDASSGAAGLLEGRLISDVPAGWEQQPDDVGDTGPSDLEKAVRDDGQDDARQVLTADGFVAGYQRLWAKGEDGQIIDFLYQYDTAEGAAHQNARMAQLNSQPEAGVTEEPFAVPGIPGATGSHLSGPDGSAAFVMFTRDGYAVQLRVNGPEATPELLTSLARQQYEKLAGTTS
ncbi:MAG: hypothetical protein JWO68_3451 [Actinomycetia bacterium]|nr:hypothetical protein [Actinomycetes bacterium]